MNRLIFPDPIGSHVAAFFTGKAAGADPDIISAIMNIRREDIYMPIQKHTDRIVLLESSGPPEIADAVITDRKGLLIGIQVADCVPILIFDRKKGISGAVHAGWRGTAEGIVKKTIGIAYERFESRPEDMLVAIGPSIRKCCYEVGFDVFDRVKRATGPGNYSILKEGKYFLDLSSANKYQALSIGIPEENIWVSGECTFCNTDKYYSYRHAGGPTGRQGAFIGMI